MPTVRSVVYLTYHFPPEVGGIQTRISKYIDRLSKRGIRVKVLVAGRAPWCEDTPLDAEVIPCPGGMRRLPASARLVTKSVIGSRADVVHVFTGSSTLLGVYALVVAKLAGAKPVISLFGREDFEFTSVVSEGALPHLDGPRRLHRREFDRHEVPAPEGAQAQGARLARGGRGAFETSAAGRSFSSHGPFVGGWSREKGWTTS